jgi:amino acid adenylation domain-containing protein
MINGFQLSPQQTRLWSFREGEKLPYLSQCAVSIRGPLDVGRLRAALATLVERHEILRTSFRCLPGMTIPLQIVEEGGAPVVREADLRDLAPAARRERISSLLREQSQGDAVFEVVSAAVEPGEHLLLVRLSGLCGDAAALRNLVADLARVYAAGPEEALDDEVVQYVNLADWQNELLESEERAPGRDYWRQQEISIPRAPLPMEAEPGAEPLFRPDSIAVNLGTNLAAGAAEVALRCGVPTWAVLHACWQVLLWRLTGEPDLVVATAFDGRRYVELKDAVGLLARFLPLRQRLAADLSFEDLVRRTGEQANDHHIWQEYFSWDQAVRAEGEPAPRFAPFAFEVVEAPEVCSGGGLDFEITHQFSCTEPFTLKLVVRPESDPGEIEIHFDSARLSRSDGEKMAGRLRSALADAIRHSAGAIGDLDVLDDTDREWLSPSLDVRAMEAPRELCIHDLFERCAQASPEALAVLYEGERVSYGELDRRANRVAGMLRDLGIGPEQRVGLCAERSVEMLAGILGVLKAGAAYVPLDPTYPPERLAFLIEDSRTEIILAREQQLPVLNDSRARVLSLDRAAADGEAAPSPFRVAVPENLAYMIYTSGSTGRPKGVQVSHRNLVQSTLTRNRYYDEPGRQLLLTSFSFDTSVAAIFGTLCFGGTLVLPPEGAQREPRWLARFIAEQRVTAFIGLPSVYRLLLQEAVPGQLDSLRTAVVAGEACLPELVSRHQEDLPGTRLCNEYGPTEGTVWCTVFDCTAVGEAQRTVPIGRAIDGAEIYLLHSRLGPVPTGVPGELFLGGPCLTRGYLDRPGLTAERFLPSPFGRETGARLYRTGDLAWRRPDGEIEFLGRTDEQVKIRGYRVELGEIEALLRAHPAVGQAAVVVREESPGNPQLVAFLVPGEQSALPEGTRRPDALVEEARRLLREHVPDYMIPSSWHVLDAMPLTANGKVDRRALEQMQSLRAVTKEHVAPRNPIEEVIAGIWGEVLRLNAVSVTADFFELGGHSLIATQVMSRVREAFQVDLPVRSLFRSPTVAGLAETLAESLGEGKPGWSPGGPPIRPVARDGVLPLSFAQQRLWLVQQLDFASPDYNVPSAVRLHGSLDVAVLRRSLDEEVRRHEILRTVFPVVHGQPVQLVKPPAPGAFPLLDLSAIPLSSQGAEVARLGREEAHRPFNLEAGPLLRASLLRLGEEEHVALLTMHHIVSDAWSTGVLIRELTAHYEAFAQGLQSSLPALPVQYADFASWQREWLQGEALEAQLAYWRRQLGGGLPRVDLPADRPRPPVRSSRGGKLPLVLSEDLSAALRQLAQREGVTLYMVLLAGFQVLLHALVEQDDLVVGTNVANRNRLETEGLIGFFINQLVLRTDLSGNPSFRELLARVREVSLAAYAQQDLPFERIVEELQPERDPSRPLLFQVKIELLNAPMSPLRLPGLTVSPFEIDRKVVRYDLHLTLSDLAGGIRGTALYSADLFDEDTIARMMEAFTAILSTAVAAPETCLGELERGIVEEERRLRSTRRQQRKRQNLDGLKQAQRHTVPLGPAAEPAVTE